MTLKYKVKQQNQTSHWDLYPKGPVNCRAAFIAEFSSDLWWSNEVNVGGGGGNSNPDVPDVLWLKTFAWDEKSSTKPKMKKDQY